MHFVFEELYYKELNKLSFSQKVDNNDN